MVQINAIHKPLYTSNKRYVYEYGGRGSSKSFAITNYCLRVSYQQGRVILFLRYTMTSASISIVPEFLRAMEAEGCEKDFHISGSQITNKITGSRIIFKGVKASSLNQTANLKSIQGLTDVIYDEFEEHPDKDSFDKLDESVREVGVENKIILSSNALHKASWQYQEFFLDTGLYHDMTEIIYTTYMDNIDNLSASWLKKVERVKEIDTSKYERDYLGIPYDSAEGALWKYGWIKRKQHAPELRRIVVAIDPAVTSKEDSDETGIVTVGKGVDDNFYILADLSGIYSPLEWANKAVNEYHAIDADRIIGEVNNGGDLIEMNLRNVDNSVSYKSVRASRGKQTRAEPIAALYERGMVYHVGTFGKLEQQLTTWNPEDTDSPDRLDALVWGLTELTQKPEAVWA